MALLDACLEVLTFNKFTVKFVKIKKIIKQQVAVIISLHANSQTFSNKTDTDNS